MNLIDKLKREFDVSTNVEILEKYSTDWGMLSPEIPRHRKLPLAVVWLRSKGEVNKLLELQKEERFHIVERGKGTNTLGGAIPVKENSIVVILGMKDFHYEKDVLVADPAVEFNDLDILSLPVFPTSYSMASIAGYVAGGSLGVGSLKYGAVWDNLLKVEVITPKGEYLLEGEDVKKVAQSAGTVGIITKVWFRLAKRGKIKVKKFKVNSLSEAIDIALKYVDTAEMITIRNKKMAHEISLLKGEDEGWEKWNVIVGIEDGDGKELEAKDIVTTFAGSYFTLVNKEKKNYMAVDLDINSLEQLEKYDYMIECDFARSRGKLLSHTYILDFDKEPKIGGHKFNLHSYKINDRVEEDRLKMIIDFKRQVDPEDFMNPGKLDF